MAFQNLIFLLPKCHTSKWTPSRIPALIVLHRCKTLHRSTLKKTNRCRHQPLLGTVKVRSSSVKTSRHQKHKVKTKSKSNLNLQKMSKLMVRIRLVLSKFQLAPSEKVMRSFITVLIPKSQIST